MKFKDILSMILVIVIFIALLFSSLLSVGIKKVKENWPKYKCNPAAMPFAGYLGYDLMGNFTSCIADIQKGIEKRKQRSRDAERKKQQESKSANAQTDKYRYR